MSSTQWQIKMDGHTIFAGEQLMINIIYSNLTNWGMTLSEYRIYLKEIEVVIERAIPEGSLIAILDPEGTEIANATIRTRTPIH